MARQTRKDSHLDAQIKQLDQDIQRLITEIEREHGPTTPPRSSNGPLHELRDRHAWAHQRLQQLRQASPEIWWI